MSRSIKYFHQEENHKKYLFIRLRLIVREKSLEYFFDWSLSMEHTCVCVGLTFDVT